MKKFSAESLRRAIAYHGPAAVAINSRMMSLKFYSQGIIDDTHCGTWSSLIVGKGVLLCVTTTMFPYRSFPNSSCTNGGLVLGCEGYIPYPSIKASTRII